MEKPGPARKKIEHLKVKVKALQTEIALKNQALRDLRKTASARDQKVASVKALSSEVKRLKKVNSQYESHILKCEDRITALRQRNVLLFGELQQSRGGKAQESTTATCKEAFEKDANFKEYEMVMEEKLFHAKVKYKYLHHLYDEERAKSSDLQQRLKRYQTSGKSDLTEFFLCPKTKIQLKGTDT